MDKDVSWSGLAVICRAEASPDHPLAEDRSGPGNDKSTYKYMTVGARQASALCSFPQTPTFSSLFGVCEAQLYQIVILEGQAHCCPGTLCLDCESFKRH